MPQPEVLAAVAVAVLVVAGTSVAAILVAVTSVVGAASRAQVTAWAHAALAPPALWAPVAALLAAAAPGRGASRTAPDARRRTVGLTMAVVPVNTRVTTVVITVTTAVIPVTTPVITV